MVWAFLCKILESVHTTFMTNDFIKFIAIIICLGIAVAGMRALSRRDYGLLVAAMAATAIADFFLVVVYDYVIGVVAFCGVQVFYNLRFGGNRRLVVLPFTLAAPAVYLAIFGDLLVAVAILYAQLFLLAYVAMIGALRRRELPATNAVLVFIGMTAFVLCDINVAIWNLGRWGIIDNSQLVQLAHGAIWLFYTPAQVCLALSARAFGKDGYYSTNQYI